VSPAAKHVALCEVPRGHADLTRRRPPDPAPAAELTPAPIGGQYSVMNFKTFDLNLLRSLDALLSERSVTRAADRVCVSQPAMSGSLQRLRDYFEDQLLIRVGREMELTPLAKSMVTSVRDVLHSIQVTLEVKPSFDPTTARRTFTASMSDYVAFVLMPLVLRRLVVQAPYMSCHVEPLNEGCFNRLDTGESDFCVATDRWRLFGENEPSAEIRSEPLFSDSFVCIVDRDHPTVTDHISLEDFKRLPHAVVRIGRGVESIVEHAWKVANLDLNIAAAAPSFCTSIFMVPGTPIVATTQERLAIAFAASLPLKIVPCPIEVPTLHEAVAWHVRHEFDPGHQYMRRIFAEAAAELRSQSLAHQPGN
jgi:LysR family transcriptional regulator, nod-box dependent transcriptional activator